MFATLAEERRRGTAELERSIVAAARTALEEHSQFRGRASFFVITACEDAIVVRGPAPSYYIKQLVQAVLARVEGVNRIDNQVTVVNPQGLSSVPHEFERPSWRLPVRATRRCLMKLA
jgi:hypothetical protein